MSVAVVSIWVLAEILIEMMLGFGEKIFVIFDGKGLPAFNGTLRFAFFILLETPRVGFE